MKHDVSEPEATTIMLAFGLTLNEARVIYAMRHGTPISADEINAICANFDRKVRCYNTAVSVIKRARRKIGGDEIENVYGVGWRVSESFARKVHAALNADEVRHDPPDAAEIRRLDKAGYSRRAIAAKTGLSYRVINRVLW